MVTQKRAVIDESAELIQALSDPILILDDRRIVKHANIAAQDLFGRTLEGRNIVQCIRHPHVVDAIEKVYKFRQPWTGEAKFPAPVERHMSLFVGVIGDGDGVAVTIRDTTLMKRTEEMHSDFVANVSHELRSPLSALLGFIETLQGPARDDKEAQVRFLGIMVQEANRMARMIDDLLSLSRVQIQEHVEPRDVIDLKATIQKILDILSLKAQERDMSFQLDCEEEVFCVIGDEDQMTQVFQNLIDNAVKYGREGTKVEIACQKLDRMPDRPVPAVQISVTDHGDGFDEQHIPRLTERFYRIDKARSRNMGGTGLGLAIVKHIIARHRGRLNIKSGIGKGSTFTVLLPAADA